jgi:hypothetical protein
MENKALQIYKDLPSWAKGVVVVGGLGAAYLFASQIIKKLRLDAEKRNAEKELDTTRIELDNQTQQGIVPSYTKSTYDAWAQSIQDQFDGCDPFFGGVFGIGGDYNELSPSAKKIYDIVDKMNNDRDFLELVDSFDIRTYDQCGWGTGNVENATLYKAVSDELSQDEINFINERLANRGITYKF